MEIKNIGGDGSNQGRRGPVFFPPILGGGRSGGFGGGVGGGGFGGAEVVDLAVVELEVAGNNNWNQKKHNLINLTDLITIIGPTQQVARLLCTALASRVDGEIISGDSRQVYRHMDIGTGRRSKRLYFRK